MVQVRCLGGNCVKNDLTKCDEKVLTVEGYGLKEEKKAHEEGEPESPFGK